MSIDQLLKQFGGDGWDGLKAMDNATAGAGNEQGSRRRETALLFDQVFSTPQGRQVLEILREGTILRDMLPPQVAAQVPVTFENIAPYVTFRAGQNAVVRQIETMLSIAAEKATEAGKRARR